ncbi:MAG: hypothetical protein ABSF72_15160 [Candidatus Sulfotelmatobacter sp.]|jgi:hypothetical protein
MHLWAIIAAVVLIVIGYVFLFKALNEHFELQHEVNANLPPDRRFEPLFWWFGTWEKFRELQREVLPASQRLKRSRGFQVMFFVLFVSGVLLLGLGLGK